MEIGGLKRCREVIRTIILYLLDHQMIGREGGEGFCGGC